MKPITVLAISEHYKPSSGGNVRYVVNLIRHLANMKCKIYLITYSPVNEFPKNSLIQIDNYTLYNIDVPFQLGYNTRLSRRYFTKAVGKKINSLIEHIRPNITHILYGHQVPAIFRFVSNNIAKIWTVHNVPPQEYATPIRLPLSFLNTIIKDFYFTLVGNYYQRKMHGYAYDHIISVSAKTCELLVKAGISRKFISVIPDGIDTDIFKPFPNGNSNDLKKQLNINGSPMILCVGGVIPHKGQLDVVNALPLIKKKYPDACFINIGNIRDNYYYSKLLSIIKSKNLNNSCFFLPSVYTDKILAKFYNACDVYVQPSYQEGFCMSALEAISCGKKIIGTDAGEIGNMIKSAYAGEVINAINPYEIANAVHILFTQYNTFQKCMSLHNYAKRNFSWQSVANKTYELYQWILFNKSKNIINS